MSVKLLFLAHTDKSVDTRLVVRIALGRLFTKVPLPYWNATYLQMKKKI